LEFCIDALRAAGMENLLLLEAYKGVWARSTRTTCFMI
jgi:hypothetical protein